MEDGSAIETARASRSGSTGQVARRAWYGVLAQAVDKVLPVAVLLYLARTLTPAEFGIYSFVLAYLMLFQAVMGKLNESCPACQGRGDLP